MTKAPITDFEEFLIEETEYQKTYRFDNNFGARVYFGPDVKEGYEFEVTSIYFDEDGTVEIYDFPSFMKGFIYLARNIFWLNTSLKSIKKEGSKSYQKGE